MPPGDVAPVLVIAAQVDLTEANDGERRENLVRAETNAGFERQ